MSRKCGGCGGSHDEFGFHPSSCKRGNRGCLWTDRHDALEAAVVWAFRFCGLRARTWGSSPWFGSAGYRPGHSRPLRGDIVAPHFLGPARHMFIDVAVACPATRQALLASPSSAHSSGVAASLREQKKVAKYGEVAHAVGGVFRGCVVERFGAVSEGLCGLIRQLAGDDDCDVLDEAAVFSASSRVTCVAQRVVLAAVMGDARMLLTVLEQDVHSRPRAGPD